MRLRPTVFGQVAIVIALAAACTANNSPGPDASSRSHASATATAIRTATESVSSSRPASGGLTPSIPAIFTSGTNACGNPYELNATSEEKTVPLVTCGGQAGSQPLPSLTIKIGQHVLLSGIRSTYGVTTQPAGRLTRQGTTYTARRSGRVLVVIHDYPYCTSPAKQKACALLAVVVTPK